MPKHMLFCLCLSESEVILVVPRSGRPVMGETRKDAQIGFRVRKDIVERFEACSRLSGKSKVDLFEEMVNDLYERLSNKKE